MQKGIPFEWAQATISISSVVVFGSAKKRAGPPVSNHVFDASCTCSCTIFGRDVAMSFFLVCIVVCGRFFEGVWFAALGLFE